MVSVIVIRSGLVDENIICKNIYEAKQVFSRFSHLLNKNSPSLDEIFNQGFVRTRDGAICISVPENTGSFAELCRAEGFSQYVGNLPVEPFLY